jgi:hypothetical protein
VLLHEDEDSEKLEDIGALEDGGSHEEIGVEEDLEALEYEETLKDESSDTFIILSFPSFEKLFFLIILHF